MIGDLHQERFVFPRWLPFEQASQQGMLGSEESIWTPNTHSLNEFERLKQEWKETFSLTIASDLIGSALVLDKLDDADVSLASKQILATSDIQWALPRSMASHMTGKNTDIAFLGDNRTTIQKLRVQLNSFPRNALGWLDMAYFFTLVGQEKKAEKCINIALTLGGKNAFIARSAARFFLHADDLDQALFHLRKHPALKSNPWILAPALSILDLKGKTTKEHKDGRQLMREFDGPSSEITELAAVLATREFKEGSSKNAKNLIRLSLHAANENSLAQAVWLTPHLNLDPSESNLEVPNQFEADARHKLAAAQFEDSLNDCRRWQQFQPFSSTPAIFGSFVASVHLSNHKLALDFIENAIPASHGEFTLHNNHAFSLAQLDRVSEARASLRKAMRLATEETDQAVFSATEGLILYREGSVMAGRTAYQSAIEQLKRLKKTGLVNIGTYFWAQEEARLDTGAITTEQLVMAMDTFSSDKSQWKTIQTQLLALPQHPK